MKEDTLIVCVSDLHSGGSTSLFPSRFWWFDKERNHKPTSLQKQMHRHWIRCAGEARLARKDKQMIVLHMGDAIEGYHHQTTQVLTVNRQEQADVHTFLMHEFLDVSGFVPGRDKLIYMRGTEAHVDDHEHRIAEEMGATIQYAPDFVELSVNGRTLWITHHGKSGGEGDTEGDTFRNWLKRTFWKCVQRKKPIPDMVMIGHRHKTMYSSYVQRVEDSYHTLHGLIVPSWQGKTRYAWGKVPLELNEIGAAFVDVLADGTIRPPRFLLMETKHGEQRVVV
jgi:hypothetical protein